jgi:hypothetical protein
MRTLVIALTFASALCGQELYQIPDNVQTRWFSPENPEGRVAFGGQVSAGRKGRPSIPVNAGEQIVLAELRGSSGTVRRI